MDLSKYYFLPGFTTNFEGEINFDKDNDIFGTDGVNYTSNNNLELIKRNSLNYDVYEIDKLQGIYIKKEYFIDKGLQFIEFEDYHFFPFLNLLSSAFSFVFKLNPNDFLIILDAR